MGRGEVTTEDTEAHGNDFWVGVTVVGSGGERV
jgi:hypothetical protein